MTFERTFDIDPFDGILGLAAQTGSFFQNLIQQGLPGEKRRHYTGNTSKHLIAIIGSYLTPNATGGAELTLGGIDRTKFNTSVSTANLTSTFGLWQLTYKEIFANGKTSSILQSGFDVV